MTAVEVLGWVATATGMTLALPQLARLFRTRNIDGLSLIGWQAVLAINIGWSMHGLRIGQLPQLFASGFGLLSTLPILYLMAKTMGRSYVPTLLPGLVLGVAMVSVDQFLGSAAYGWCAIAPALVALGGQSIELVRAPDVLGVSTPSLLMGTLNQALWTTWSILIGDPGSVISAVCATILVAFNLVWFVMRRLGLRAFFPHAVVTVPTLIAAGEGVDV